MKSRLGTGILVFMVMVLVGSCASVPDKKFYTMNYQAEPLSGRVNPAPYPFTIRVKKFEIEQAYARPQLVYRKSPFQLSYYFYRVWAVSPAAMITDLVEKHLSAVGLVSNVVRRMDESAKPDFELTGNIEAIEEYDNDNVWFAHLAFRLQLTRVKDNRVVYSRRFDSRKQVFEQNPEHIVRELSRLMDLLMSQAVRDLDGVLGREYGLAAPEVQQTPFDGDSADTQPKP